MNAPLLEVSGLTKVFHLADGRPVNALDGVSFNLARGETLGIVGESGCGKTTLGRALLRLIEPSSGKVRFDGDDFLGRPPRDVKRLRRRMQIVFQDPFASLNPRHKVGAILTEPLIVHDIGDSKARARRLAELLDIVGLPDDSASRYPHEFSGGQRQRIAIARALALEPDLIVADEPVSALDVSIQSQILNLIADLKRRLGIAFLFISHDLNVVRHVSDRVAVMYFGRIVELVETEKLFAAPAHPYTQALLAAIPRAEPGRRPERAILSGEMPDPADPPRGCALARRCPQAFDLCHLEKPALALRQHTGSTRLSACHLHSLTTEAAA